MELEDLIIDQLDPDELIEILGLTTEDLVVLLKDEIDAKRDRFFYLSTRDTECSLPWEE